MTTPKSTDHDKANRDNRSRQLNPNNDVYWQSRGHEERPPNPEVPIPAPRPEPTTGPQRRR